MGGKTVQSSTNHPTGIKCRQSLQMGAEKKIKKVKRFLFSITAKYYYATLKKKSHRKMKSEECAFQTMSTC